MKRTATGEQRKEDGEKRKGKMSKEGYPDQPQASCKRRYRGGTPTPPASPDFPMFRDMAFRPTSIQPIEVGLGITGSDSVRRS